jgi:hypothetical protein
MQHSRAGVQVRATGVGGDLPRDLLVLLAWLAIFGLGLRLLIGWPSAPGCPDVLPSTLSTPLRVPHAGCVPFVWSPTV